MAEEKKRKKKKKTIYEAFVSSTPFVVSQSRRYDKLYIYHTHEVNTTHEGRKQLSAVLPAPLVLRLDIIS
jgi:hypothetical protein